jgi:hypothetical protein
VDWQLFSVGGVAGCPMNLSIVCALGLYVSTKTIAKRNIIFHIPFS